MVLPAALKFGVLGMIGGALLGEVVRQKTRAVTLARPPILAQFH